ncbi:MAG: tetratricopeptide repeat protein [Atopobiaceae bacterium]|nr:tetratricopeptide repeat protein [Atopobiaceae bacterium]
MNQQAFDAGRDAYRQGDYVSAVRWLEQAKQPGEVSGRIDHLLGNCLMKLGNYDQAAIAYGDALQDASYGHAGALASNRGRALLAAGKPQEAVASLVMATKDSGYSTPYKAYIALGNAYSEIGDFREAGVAYRNAAIDETNPDPSGALRSLGGCFMKMGRAVDAVEAYRTALDFSTPLESQDAIYEDLGLAYAAANRWSEAIDSFGHATDSGNHKLSDEAAAALEVAKAAVSSQSTGASGSTDAFLAAASGYGSGNDPLDPLGKSGEFIPSPEDTGFFDITEQEMVQLEMDNRSIRRKHRSHSGLRGLLIFLLFLILIGGGLSYAYYCGYGWPLQESVVEDLFTTKANGGDISGLLAKNLSDEDKMSIEAVLPSGATGVTVEGVDRSMTESSALATVTLSAGGEQSYRISLVRSGLGWKVSGVTVEYPALEGGQPTISTGLPAEQQAAPAEGEAAVTEAAPETTEVVVSEGEAAPEGA